MSEQRLKDLLGELVDDVPRPDGPRVDSAWDAARRRHRRSGVLVAAGAVAVLLVGTTVVVGSRTNDSAPPPDPGTPRPTPSAPQDTDRTPESRPPDSTYKGTPVWWAPDAADESRLDQLESVLPTTVDLSPGRPTVEPGEPALGVYTIQAGDGGPLRVVALSPDGSTAELPTEQLRANRDQDGNGAALTPPNGGLSPDGRHAFFAQQSSIELYDFGSGEWTTIDTPDWLAEGARWLDADTIWVPNGLLLSGVGTTYDADGRLLDPEEPRIFSDLDVAAADEPYGIWVYSAGASAGSYFFAGPIGGGPYTNPEGIVARVGNERSVLALGVEGRGKGCCPVVGWLSDDVLAFQSSTRVLAWEVGTGTLHRVSELVGLDPEREWTSSSWAWQALR